VSPSQIGVSDFAATLLSSPFASHNALMVPTCSRRSNDSQSAVTRSGPGYMHVTRGVLPARMPTSTCTASLKTFAPSTPCSPRCGRRPRGKAPKGRHKASCSDQELRGHPTTREHGMRSVLV
jgi:hypothetical protein